MAFTGKSTYGAGAGLPELVEDVSDIIGIVSPYETPLLDHIGDAKKPATSTVHEWIEDALIPNTGAISDPGIVGTDTDFIVADVTPFRVGDLVRPGNTGEVMLVTAVDTGTSSLTVTRGYGGTTQATLADAMALTILGNAALEGADAPAARFTSRVRKQNYTQIFTASVDVSGSMQAANQHGITDEVDYQKQERMRELLRDLENTVINGVAPSGTQEGSGTVRRTMNGIIHSISTNTFQPGVNGMPAGNSGALDEALLNAAMRAVWEQSSGTIDTIVCGGKQKRKINSFATGSRAYLPEDTRYSDMVSVYESDFGVARVILSRWVPEDSVLLLDSSRIGVLPLAGRSFHYKPLAATGDSVSGQVIGEYTLEFKNENAHGVLSGLVV
ncbi:MAG TPA: hypothetical protein ENK11_10710 [Phycisphaerales bacterium]|nr:hypothetical protein [Phycisphaerales bacterium]